MELKEQIKALRIIAQMTKGEVGAALGKHAATVANWERGKTEPAFTDMLRLKTLARKELDRLNELAAELGI